MFPEAAAPGPAGSRQTTLAALTPPRTGAGVLLRTYLNCWMESAWLLSDLLKLCSGGTTMSEPRTTETLPTIWEVPDDLWTEVAAILAELDPPHRGGRPRIDQRAALNGIIFRLRSGVQWNRLPREFGDDSSVHRTMQRWEAKGVWPRLVAVLVEGCEELGDVEWDWQAADGCLGKARMGGIKSVRTPPTVARTAPRRAC